MVNISHMIHIPVSDCHVSLLHPNCLQLHCDKALRCYIDLQNWLRRTNEGNMGRTVAIDDIFVRWWFANKLLTNTSKSTTDTEQPSRKYNNAAMPVKISTLLGGAWKKPWCGKKTVKHQLQELHQTPKLQMNAAAAILLVLPEPLWSWSSHHRKKHCSFTAAKILGPAQATHQIPESTKAMISPVNMSIDDPDESPSQ